MEYIKNKFKPMTVKLGTLLIILVIGAPFFVGLLSMSGEGSVLESILDWYIYLLLMPCLVIGGIGVAIQTIRSICDRQAMKENPIIWALSFVWLSAICLFVFFIGKAVIVALINLASQIQRL